MRIRIIIAAVVTTFCMTSLSGAIEDKKSLVISLCEIYHPSDDRIQWTCYKRPLGKNPQQLWGDYWIDVLRFNRLDRLHFPEVNSLKVPTDLKALREFSVMPPTYAPAEKEAKYILVDQSEQFLGAYAFGRLVFSAPITVGEAGTRTPRGIFRITAFDRDHKSTEYKLPGSKEPYPMRHGLMFHTDSDGIQYWIHGRDMPGYPGSHGCIGLYDEVMEKNYMGEPGKPVLRDAQRLFEWVVDNRNDPGTYRDIADGPKVEIRGTPPKVKFEHKKKKRTGGRGPSMLA